MSLYLHRGGPDRDGRPVVFIHGAGMDHSVWRFQTRWLAHRGFRVVAPDLPGHGRSDGEPFGSIEEGAAWLADLLSREGMEGATVVGHSMGALIALESATAPLSGQVVLVAGAARMPVHPVLLAAARRDLPRAAAFIAGWSFPPSHRGGHPEPGTWQQGITYRLVERSQPGVLATDLEACTAYEGPQAEAVSGERLTVISGTGDRMVPSRASRKLVEEVAGSRLVSLEGAGHEPMLEVPYAFNRELLTILNGDGKG